MFYSNHLTQVSRNEVIGLHLNVGWGLIVPLLQMGSPYSNQVMEWSTHVKFSKLKGYYPHQAEGNKVMQIYTYQPTASHLNWKLLIINT